MSKPIMNQADAYQYVKKLIDGFMYDIDEDVINQYYHQGTIGHFGDVDLNYNDIINRLYYLQENYVELKHVLLNVICFDNFIVANDLQFYRHKNSQRINRVDLTVTYRVATDLRIAEVWLMTNVDYNYKASQCEDDDLINEHQGLTTTSKQSILNDFKYTINKKLSQDFPEVTFTDREMDTLFYTLTGYTSKESGKMLGLSHRTVESYLDNIKDKLHCNSKSEIRKALIPGGMWL